MQSDKSSSHFISIGVNLGVTVLCIVPTWIVLSELECTHEEQAIEGNVVFEKNDKSHVEASSVGKV